MTPNLIYHLGTGHRTGRRPRRWLFLCPLQCLSLSTLSLSDSVTVLLYHPALSISLSHGISIYLSLSNNISLLLSVCQILPKGVVSVIGPASSPASGSTVSHICGEKEVRMKGSAFAYVSVRAFLEMINLHCSSATGHYFLCAFALLLEKHLPL